MLLPIFLYFQVKATAENVDEAVRELPDANLVRYSFFFALCLSLDWLLGGFFENHDLSLSDFVLFLLIYRHKCLLWRLCLITFCGTMLMCAKASYLKKKKVNIGMDRITEVFDWYSTFIGWFQLLMGPTLIFPLFSLCYMTSKDEILLFLQVQLMQLILFHF